MGLHVPNLRNVHSHSENALSYATLPRKNQNFIEKHSCRQIRVFTIDEGFGLYGSKLVLDFQVVVPNLRVNDQH